MAKDLVPLKMIISFDGNGQFENGLLLYKLRVNGVIEDRQKSISIKNMAFSKLHLANIIDIVIEKTEKQEGTDG